MTNTPIEPGERQWGNHIENGTINPMKIMSQSLYGVMNKPEECFRAMETWDKSDDPVLLLVDYHEGQHPLTDARFSITIGHNNDHNVGEGEGLGWQFAGWCWSHDHYTEGKGRPVGWLPLPHHLAEKKEEEENEISPDTTDRSSEQ